ncbi:MAG TPA: hypothetical protein PK529_03830 [Verrucomicrobiales bacterium]|nr:hypothetical protein [Verrucomicrobiales bacterium]
MYHLFVIVALTGFCACTRTERIDIHIPKGDVVVDRQLVQGGVAFGYKIERFVKIKTSPEILAKWASQFPVKELEIFDQNLVPSDISMIFPDLDWKPEDSTKSFYFDGKCFGVSYRFSEKSGDVYLKLVAGRENGPIEIRLLQ